MNKNNQSGFSAVEILLVILVIAILGGIGWFFYKHYKKAPASTTTTTTVTKSETSTSTPATVDPTASWTAFSDTVGKYALRYPTTWVKVACPSGPLFLAPTTDVVGRCNSEFSGQIIVTSSTGDTRANYGLTSTGYDSIIKTDVTVDGVAGKKESGVVKASTEPDYVGTSLKEGTIVVNYIFYTGGNTYVARYNQQPAYTDVLSDFNLMVTKTLDFTP